MKRILLPNSSSCTPHLLSLKATPDLIKYQDEKPPTKLERLPDHLYHLIHKLLAPRDIETQSLTSLPYKSGKIQTQLSVSILLYRDNLCLLYDCTQFVFASSKCSSSTSSFSIPRKLKLRSDENWYLLCERITLDLKALRIVLVDSTVFDAPFELEVGESVRDGRSKGAADHEVQLKSSRSKDERLRDVERQLEKEMTNLVAVQIREDERLARELAGPEKAGAVLRLISD
ncbi:hypothetical protein BDW75DRAFT_231580 [Aspergillus navahoensis]